MKRALSAIIVTLALSLGCGTTEKVENKSTDNPPPDQTPAASSYSGYFQISKVMTGSDCAVPAVFSDYGNITVSDTTIDFFGFEGMWDEGTKHGIGTVPNTIVVSPGCSRQITTTFDITYSSYDAFTGTMDIAFSDGTGCVLTPCNTTYDITGTREL